MFRVHRTRVLRLVAAGALLLIAGSALAFSSGPPDGYTNAPGEGNCTACHSTFPLNSGSGMLSLAGLPASWQPGADYDLTLSLSDPNSSPILDYFYSKRSLSVWTTVPIMLSIEDYNAVIAEHIAEGERMGSGGGKG